VTEKVTVLVARVPLLSMAMAVFVWFPTVSVLDVLVCPAKLLLAVKVASEYN